VTTTYADIVNEVIINLQGYTMQQDRATSLSAALTSTTTTTVSVTSTSDIGKGIIEIGEELMWVENFDRVANTLSRHYTFYCCCVQQGDYQSDFP
jgi:hypothetical protein